MVVAQFVSRTPAAVSVSAEPVPLAAWLITNVVELVTEAMVVGTVPVVGVVVLTMFVPVSNMPGINPVVLAQVTVVESPRQNRSRELPIWAFLKLLDDW